MRRSAAAGIIGPTSLSTSRVIGAFGAAAIIMPQMPPSEVPIQATSRPIAASRWESAWT